MIKPTVHVSGSSSKTVPSKTPTKKPGNRRYCGVVYTAKVEVKQSRSDGHGSDSSFSNAVKKQESLP